MRTTPTLTGAEAQLRPRSPPATTDAAREPCSGTLVSITIANPAKVSSPPAKRVRLPVGPPAGRQQVRTDRAAPDGPHPSHVPKDRIVGDDDRVLPAALSQLVDEPQPRNGRAGLSGDERPARAGDVLLGPVPKPVRHEVRANRLGQCLQHPNVLVMGLRLTSAELAREMLDAWFAGEPDPSEAANIARLE
jgi:hypothetical protein